MLRKLAHLTEYGVLWLLWWRALGFLVATALPAVAIALLYAATDEWHQSFVTGRHGSPVDWAIDALGVGIAVALLLPRAARVRPSPAQPSRA